MSPMKIVTPKRRVRLDLSKRKITSVCLFECFIHLYRSLWDLIVFLSCNSTESVTFSGFQAEHHSCLSLRQLWYNFVFCLSVNLSVYILFCPSSTPHVNLPPHSVRRVSASISSTRSTSKKWLPSRASSGSSWHFVDIRTKTCQNQRQSNSSYKDPEGPKDVGHLRVG